MVLVNDPASIWVQLASFSFFAAGFFSDILIVRLSLASAYTFLLINASLGSPLWPNIRRANALSLDGLIWAVLNLYVLFSGIARLLMDESQVTFASDEEEALWRLFYRLGGVSRKVFQSNICRHMKVVHCKPGQKLSVESNFYILYKGIVNLDIYDKDQVIATGQDGSGSMFDFKNLGLLHNEKRFKSQLERTEDNHKKIARQLKQPEIENIDFAADLIWTELFVMAKFYKIVDGQVDSLILLLLPSSLSVNGRSKNEERVAVDTCLHEFR